MNSLSLFTRNSAGDLTIASYHPRYSQAWHWSVSIGKSRVVRKWWLVSRSPMRSGQWHDFYQLPFGLALAISRQDYHKAQAT